jgi:hypothetical protein
MPEDMDRYAKYVGILAVKPHPTLVAYLKSRAFIRCIFKGNQGGGTQATAGYDAPLRILGLHPVAERNNLMDKPIRFVSKVVPEDKDDEDNQQYVCMRSVFGPMGAIVKNITARNKTMHIRNIRGYGPPVFKAEFMASTQELDAFMSVQRSAYYQDEEIEKNKWNESIKRLMKAGGDVSVSVTPVKGLDWMYDSLWCKAQLVVRSSTVCAKFGYPAVDITGKRTGIECFQWATDDNPGISKEAIDQIFENFDDADELAMARYGVFKQVSGRIYKSFDKRVHVLPFDDWFSEDLFRTYWQYRVIDFHQKKPWYVTFAAVTPTHEWFVWQEIVASHDNRTTYELRDEIKDKSLLDEDTEFNRATLIDPLSKVEQGNTGMTTFSDLETGENGLRRLEAADTKGSPVHGREHIKMRLRNSIICGHPGNNVINDPTKEEARFGLYRPTLWILDSCPKHIEQIEGWRYVDYVQERVRATRTTKRESEKNQDFCRNLEFLGSHNPAYWAMTETEDTGYWDRRRFQGQRVAAYA